MYNILFKTTQYFQRKLHNEIMYNKIDIIMRGKKYEIITYTFYDDFYTLFIQCIFTECD